MEQFPSQKSPKEDETEERITAIPEGNLKTADPFNSQLDATTDQTVYTNSNKNIEIADESANLSNAKENQKEHTPLLRNNSKINSKLASKLTNAKSDKSQTKIVTTKTQELADATSIESDKQFALSPVKTNNILNEGSKPSLLPTPRKNTSPVEAASKMAQPTKKPYIPGKASTCATSPVNSKIPAVKTRVSNISLSSKSKTVNCPTTQTKQQTQPQSLRSTSKLSLNKPETIRTGANKKISPNFSKTSVATTWSNASKFKGESKIQSARSSGTTVPSVNKRSASIVSSRSIPVSKKENSQTNLRKMTSTAGDYTVIESLEEKLKNEQTEFLREMQNLKLAYPEKVKCEFKLLTMTINNERQLMIKDDELFELPKKLPVNKVSDFKEQIQKNIDDWFDTFKDDVKSSSEHDQFEKLQILKSNISSYADRLCSSYEDTSDSQIVKMQTELLESNKALKKTENHLTYLTKQHEEQLLKQKNNFNAEINKLHTTIKSLEQEYVTVETALQVTEQENQAEIKNLHEQLKSSREGYISLNKKLHAKEQQLSHEINAKNEMNKKFEKELMEMENLKSSLAEMTTRMEELKAAPKSTNACLEHVQQIAELKNVIDTLEKDKINMKEKTDKLEAESLVITELSNKLKEAESQVINLEKQLEEKKKSPETIPACSRDLQMELHKIRQSEEEKRREIEKLKIMLSRYEHDMSQLDERLQREQHLLQVRSELINSLQSNEASHRNQMEELFAQIGEKNNIINELQNELQIKSEEFKNLFSTFGAKQMELSNQEHIIKLLEESNERSQMLRVKQEEKIGRMEDELSHLKQTISIYQANILSGLNCKNLLFAPMLPPSNLDCNENYYYYSSQRKRKRQNDIVVKKYEA